jgi:hypothetical protein
VRPLCPVRLVSAETSGAGPGADTLARAHFASAPIPQGRPQLLAGRWPRGTGLTSYLSGYLNPCNGATWFFTPPRYEIITRFAKLAGSPVFPFRFRYLPAWGDAFRRIAFRPKLDHRLAYRSSRNPLGHGINIGFETSPMSDSICSRFLISRLIAQLLIRVTSGTGTTPSRGAGDICLLWNKGST